MKKRFWVIIGLLLVATITCSCGPPKEQESSATVIEAVNTVDAHPRPKDDWGAATVGMDIYGGGQVRTGPASSARLQLLEGVVRLWAESMFTVRESTTRQERLVTTLFLQKGRLWAHLTTNQPHEFTVETASAVAAVRDTRFSVKVDLDQTALVSVAEGEVVLTAQEESVTVVAGQQAIVKPGQPPSPPEPMSDEERALWATEGEMPELESLLPTPMPTLTPTIIPTPTPTDTLVPTNTPVPAPTPSDTPVPTDTPALEPTPTNTPVPPTPAPIGGGRIVFVSDRDGNEEIYVMNADGSGQTNLTNHPARDYVPFWSSDGALIAFASERDGNSEIYVMNADGSGLTRLTDNPASDYHPAWSPDGTRITFTSSRDGDWGEIYVMNADGSGQARLTNDPALDWEPAWSPDGMRIAFTSGRDGKDEIYVMNADGSGQMNLTSPGVDIIPAWSPDGTRIAFASGRDGNMEIYVMNADGSGQTRLTDNPAWDDMATWSPDGTRIAFMSQRDSGNAEIYVMNADGSGLTRLTNNPAHDMWPSWSPR